ncbi:CRAL/TRIO domain-containing protein [Babesia caballi]|uniref:CRAL/TRIO domain-containing protein n=1 Tax=Babesia caballi TaxID=5871 RepID=A0AAV4LWN8_BABCB|nr:CRAL/TRIO domain-containing protein [Babesia caballi]
MDFMKLFRRKSDSEELSSFEIVDPVDLSPLKLVDGMGPPPTPSYQENCISLRDFLAKWKKWYPLELDVDSVITKVHELKELLWSMPMLTTENPDDDHGRKWYKLWNVDPVEQVKLSELYWCTDIVLFRYLRSYKFKVQQAFHMIRKTLAWRRFKKLDSLDPDFLGSSNAGGMVYRKGYDKSGRPLLYYRPRDEVDYDREKQVCLIFFGIERALESQLLMHGNDKVVVFVDLVGWSLSKMPTVELVIDTIRALAEHYTDVVNEVVIVDAPLLFDPLMQMIKAVIDSSTAKKVIIKSRGPKLEKHLFRFADPDQIEVSMGGDNRVEYDHDTYWPYETKLALEAKERRDKWMKEHEAEWLERHKGGAGEHAEGQQEA